MKLDEPITNVKGVGHTLGARLNTVGIKTVRDLIDYYPRKYDDYSKVQEISTIKPGMVTIRARIKQITTRYVRRGMNITEAVASDESGSVRLIWFNQPYRSSGANIGAEYFIRGNFELRRQRLCIMNPTIELVGDFPIHSARIVPTYRATKGLKVGQLRKMMATVTKGLSVPETLPDWIISENNLLSREEAYKKLHFPETMEDVEKAKKRFGFEEIFQLSLASTLNKIDNSKAKAFKIEFDEMLAKKFVEDLPFSLTTSQRKAVWRIYQDMGSNLQMNRLLEGDVGSGKTVVSAMAAVMVLASGYQVALMAPTEILARQHVETLRNLLKPLELDSKILLLVGSMTVKQKESARVAISSGRAGLIVGTSALIQEGISINKLALVVIDEQHRFGVEQRKKLQSKSGKIPHLLSMTATPIPRSLALTVYGELDITLLDEKPKNRQMIITEIISPNSTKGMYKNINNQILAGRQAIIVCPAIEGSEEPARASVTEFYKSMQTGELSKHRIGLLHGKLKTNEKENIMEKFACGNIDVLITTTVIEVGVDVPNATVMVIVNPEMFGLAQMHQLRGRVGRGEHQSYCYLLMSDSRVPSRRIRALGVKYNGFELAELDLEIRGPGAIYGVTQHGVIDLRVANLSDVKLIESAREAARKFIDNNEKFSNFPELKHNIDRLRKVTNLS